MSESASIAASQSRTKASDVLSDDEDFYGEEAEEIWTKDHSSNNETSADPEEKKAAARKRRFEAIKNRKQELLKE